MAKGGARKKPVRLPKRAVTRQEFEQLGQQYSEAVQQRRAAAQVAQETLAAGRALFTEADGTREERLERTMWSPLEFGRTYLPHFFQQEAAEFHHALDQVIAGNYTDEDVDRWSASGIEVHRGDPELRLTAIMIPRGFGKSVIAVVCDYLRRICHGLDPYLLLVMDTYDQAAAALEDIKEELSSNEKIRADFGNLVPQAEEDWIAGGLDLDATGKVVWREGQIVCRNSTRVDAFGKGAKTRGRRHGPSRPTHSTCDDLDNDENVVTKEQREKSWNWVMSALVPAMDPLTGSVTVIGTVIHFDCVIARAAHRTDEDGDRLFTSIKFVALRRNPETGEMESTWPARFTTKALMRKKALLGATKFGAEYLNSPRDEGSRVFDPNNFYYYKQSEIESLKATTTVTVLYVDPSKGKKGKGRKKSDYSGFAKVKANRAERITYVLDAFRDRLTPSQAKHAVVKWYKRELAIDPTAQLWVEENSFGDVLGETFQSELRTQGIDRPVHTLLHTSEKEARLDSHSIRVESNGVRFPERWERDDRRPEWFAEYEDFPAAANDDTIDAIESADHIACELSAVRAEYRSSGKKLDSVAMAAY
ncbi:MAG TPA: phage terminase large subunit [Blastocatellia bacterium]